MGKGDDTAQQTTTTDIQRASLSPALQTSLQGFTELLGGAAGSPTPLPTDLLTPQLSPEAEAARQAAAGEQGRAPMLEGATEQTLLDLLGGGINPFIQQAIDAAVRPVRQQFQEVIRPGIRDIAIRGGALRGSGREELEARAARDFAQAVGSTSAQVATPLFESARQIQLGAVPFAQQQAGAPARRLLELLQTQDIPRGIESERVAQQRADFLRLNPDPLSAGRALTELGALEFSAPVIGQTETTGAALPEGGFADKLGPLGALGGLGLGALLAPATGGLSIPISMLLGAGVGGLAGSSAGQLLR